MHDNVGPDKVIDSFQTAFKNAYLQSVWKSDVVPDPRTTWNDYVTGLNLHFQRSRSASFSSVASSGSQGAAMSRYMMEAMENEGGSGGMDRAQEEEMKLVAKKIARSF